MSRAVADTTTRVFQFMAVPFTAFAPMLGWLDGASPRERAASWGLLHSATMLVIWKFTNWVWNGCAPPLGSALPMNVAGKVTPLMVRACASHNAELLKL